MLLIDDQEIVGEAVRRMLADAPEISFEQVTDPREAAARAVEIGAGVILLDLVMPNVDGMTLVDTFRSMPELVDVPLVVLSSHEDPVLKASAFRRGANDYLVKLPAAVELVARVRYHAAAHALRLERNAAYEKLKRYAASLARERQKSDQLLLNVMPRSVAERLKGGEALIADSYPNTTVCFADLVGFTGLAEAMEPDKLVRLLNAVFSEFDDLADGLGVEKIKTIGDAYMAAAGVPNEREDHAAAIARFALKALDVVPRIGADFGHPLKIRVGLHSGPVVAGIIGKRKFIYDLWGDTVNVASRLESHGLPNKIQISGETRALLGDEFDVVERGRVRLKGRGIVRTFFVEGVTDG